MRPETVADVAKSEVLFAMSNIVHTYGINRVLLVKKPDGSWNLELGFNSDTAPRRRE